jgi:hypothetical protein
VLSSAANRPKVAPAPPPDDGQVLEPSSAGQSCLLQSFGSRTPVCQHPLVVEVVAPLPDDGEVLLVADTVPPTPEEGVSVGMDLRLPQQELMVEQTVGGAVSAMM